MKKSRECSASSMADFKSSPSKESNVLVSGLISTTSTADSLQCSEPMWCARLKNSDKITDITETTVKFDKTVNGKSRTNVKPSKSDPKSAECTPANVAARRRKPHIEHREKSTTHLSNANLSNFQEHLSKDELLILSELAHAASLPDEVRTSLLLFLNQHRLAMDIVNIDKTEREQLKTSVNKNIPKFEWTFDEVDDPIRLKEMLVHVAKVLQTDKKSLLDVAVERECILKEDAYHASMASFVELCIRTGMVRQELYFSMLINLMVYTAYVLLSIKLKTSEQDGH